MQKSKATILTGCGIMILGFVIAYILGHVLPPEFPYDLRSIFSMFIIMAGFNIAGREILKKWKL